MATTKVNPPAPSPDTPEVLNQKPKVFADPTSPAQKAWLTAIHERWIAYLSMQKTLFSPFTNQIQILVTGPCAFHLLAHRA